MRRDVTNSGNLDRNRFDRYALLLGACVVLMLATFLVAGAFSLELLHDPTPWLAGGGVVAAAIGTALLLADVLIPVPASIVMLANGAVFGVVGGALLSLAGAVGATMLGYALGRFAGPAVLRRVCSAQELARADGLIRRWGVPAVAVTRPVPLLAETVAIAVGASSLGAGRTLVAATAGSVPGCVLLAVAGAAGVGAPLGVLVFGLVVAVSGGLWFLGRGLPWPDEPGIARSSC